MERADVAHGTTNATQSHRGPGRARPNPCLHEAPRPFDGNEVIRVRREVVADADAREEPPQAAVLVSAQMY